MGCCSSSSLMDIKILEDYLKEYEKSLTFSKNTLTIIKQEYYRQSLHLNFNAKAFDDFCEALEIKSDSREYELIRSIALKKQNISDQAKMLLLIILLCRDPIDEKIRSIFDIYDSENSKKIQRNQIRNMIRHIYEVSCKEITYAVSSLKDLYGLRVICKYKQDLNKYKDVLIEYFTNIIVSNKETVSYEEFFSKMISHEVKILFYPSCIRRLCLKIGRNMKDRKTIR